jgi:hypothetical protein
MASARLAQVLRETYKTAINDDGQTLQQRC